MSLFSDLFTSGYDKAAGAASAGLSTGYNMAVPQYGAALQSLQPATAGANAGANAYAGALGIGGDPAQIQKQLEATPGYQFTLGQGLQAIDRGAASRGLTTSGKHACSGAEVLEQDSPIRHIRTMCRNLQPYLQQQTQTGALNAGVYGSLGNLGYNTQAAKGNAQAAADIAGQNAQNSFISGIVEPRARGSPREQASADRPIKLKPPNLIHMS